MKKFLIAVWIIALLITLGGSIYLAHRFWTFFSTLPAMSETISPLDWAVITLVAAIYYLLEYFRLYCLLRLVGETLPIKKGLRVIFVTEFASVLTPTAELHIPAAVYALTRAGISSEKAAAAAAMKTIFGTFWICLFALLALFTNGNIQLPRIISENLAYFAVPIAALGALYLATMLFAGPFVRWTQRQEQRKLPRWKRALAGWFGKSTQAMARIESSTQKYAIAGHLCNVGRVLCYCFAGYWIARSVGLPISLHQALAVFSISMMIDYFAPVPGSIGVTEFSIAYMLDPKLSSAAVFSAIVLRVFCKYAVLLPGLIVGVRLIKSGGSKIFSALRQRHSH